MANLRQALNGLAKGVRSQAAATVAENRALRMLKVREQYAIAGENRREDTTVRADKRREAADIRGDERSHANKMEELGAKPQTPRPLSDDYLKVKGDDGGEQLYGRGENGQLASVTPGQTNADSDAQLQAVAKDMVKTHAQYGRLDSTDFAKFGGSREAAEHALVQELRANGGDPVAAKKAVLDDPGDAAEGLLSKPGQSQASQRQLNKDPSAQRYRPSGKYDTEKAWAQAQKDGTLPPNERMPATDLATAKAQMGLKSRFQSFEEAFADAKARAQQQGLDYSDEEIAQWVTSRTGLASK